MTEMVNLNGIYGSISKYLLTLWNLRWEIHCCPPHIQPVKRKYILLIFVAAKLLVQELRFDTFFCIT